MRAYLLTILAAATVTYLLAPLVRRFAVQSHAMSPVRDRDVHATPVPRLGGLAMLGGLAAGLLVSSQLPLTSRVFLDSGDWQGLLSGAVAITLLGAADDKWDLDPLTKLAGQVFAAGLMALQGVQVLWVPLIAEQGVLVLTPSVGIPLTVLLVVLAANAMNFIDGLDGLAAGIGAIAGLAFFIFSYFLSVEEGLERASAPTLISALLVGVCLGFVPHNFFPARLFMGDAGSMLLGLMLAACTITLTGGVEPTGIQSTNIGPAVLPLLLPVLAILVPLVDLVLAIVRRTSARRSPFAPDKQHLHHRLLEIGHSHPRAVLLMYMWSVLMGGGVLLVASLGGTWPVVILVAALIGLLVLTLNLRRHHRPAA